MILSSGLYPCSQKIIYSKSALQLFEHYWCVMGLEQLIFRLPLSHLWVYARGVSYTEPAWAETFLLIIRVVIVLGEARLHTTVKRFWFLRNYTVKILIFSLSCIPKNWEFLCICRMGFFQVLKMYREYSWSSYIESRICRFSLEVIELTWFGNKAV